MSEGCEEREALLLRPGEGGALAAALMFAAGVLGNLAALALLLRARARRRARRERPSAFPGLALALVLTDLLGTCLLSPAVLAAYGRGRALRALAGGRLCAAFAFAMAFFGLAGTGTLGAMALERCLALGAPYRYARLLRGRRAALLPLAALPALHALFAALCALPLLGFGRYVQYCPGTWCFLQLHFPGGAGDRRALAFALLYAALLLLLVLAVLLCNLRAIACLLRMRRARPAPAARPPPSVAQELDHLVLLALMTLVFAGCSLPFTVRTFMNLVQEGDYKADLQAMRLLSINSIIDPWVFIILRPPVLRLIRSVLCCRVPLKPQAHIRDIPPLANTQPAKQGDCCNP
ncbi:prostaglandin E2 receptor EP2 subtype [Tiliqua scincoides]|uniref:prostaglandin E2 receptor EP2 subtype n=1 Tax=Tiliqua scincoides TaxID=71010 RepID=UPI0034621274